MREREKTWVQTSQNQCSKKDHFKKQTHVQKNSIESWGSIKFRGKAQNNSLQHKFKARIHETCEDNFWVHNKNHNRSLQKTPSITIHNQNPMKHLHRHICDPHNQSNRFKMLTWTKTQRRNSSKQYQNNHAPENQSRSWTTKVTSTNINT